MKLIVPTLLIALLLTFYETSTADPYLHLEEISSESSLKFASDRNLKSMDYFRSKADFQTAYQTSLEIYDDKDKIVYASIVKDIAYNFWQDENNERGLWRRMPAKDYLAGKRIGKY